MNILEVKGLKTYFFTRRGVVRAVDSVSFDLRKGEVLCLVGESGSGKTVSALSILGLVDPPGRILEGEILLDGEDLKGYAKQRRIRGQKIGMIFQDPKESLNPVLTIGEQIMEPMKYHLGLSAEEAEKKTIYLLEKVGIHSAGERLKSYPHEFSGGMNQRVMIAIALSCDPDILIADEPTSALDVTTQYQFLKMLMDLKREKGTPSIIFITHDLGIVAEIADRVVVMYAGKIMEKGDVWQIFDKPRHPYTIGLLNSLPDVTVKSRLTPIPGVIPSLINPPGGCIFHTRCRFVQDICTRVIPPEMKVGEGHFSACHFYDSEEVMKASVRI